MLTGGVRIARLMLFHPITIPTYTARSIRGTSSYTPHLIATIILGYAGMSLSPHSSTRSIRNVAPDVRCEHGGSSRADRRAKRTVGSLPALTACPHSSEPGYAVEDCTKKRSAWCLVQALSMQLCLSLRRHLISLSPSVRVLALHHPAHGGWLSSEAHSCLARLTRRIRCMTSG